MVGGLVQQQDVGVFGQGAGQGHAADFATGKTLGRFLPINAKQLQRGLGLIVFGPACGGVVEHRLAGDLRLLRHNHYAGAGLDHPLTVIGLDQPGQHF